MQRDIRKISLYAGESDLQEETVRGRSAEGGQVRQDCGWTKEATLGLQGIESGTFLGGKVNGTWWLNIGVSKRRDFWYSPWMDGVPPQRSGKHRSPPPLGGWSFNSQLVCQVWGSYEIFRWSPLWAFIEHLQCVRSAQVCNSCNGIHLEIIPASSPPGTQHLIRRKSLSHYGKWFYILIILMDKELEIADPFTN